MRTKSLLFCCLLLPFLGESQTRPTLDVLTGYEYSYRTLTMNGMDIREDEEGIFTFRYGLHYNQPLSENWTLKLGLHYVQNGSRTPGNELRWGSQHNGTGGFTPDTGNASQSVAYETQHRFLSVPVALRYALGGTQKKLSFYVEAGTAISHYLTTKNTSTVTGEGSQLIRNVIDDLDGIHQWHLLGSLAFGANYGLGERTQLFLQPTFRYHLTPLADGPFKEHLYNVGLEIGGRFAIL
jgi:hypothetical protein